MKQKMYYAGYTIISGEKLGHCLISLDGKEDNIYFSNKSVPHAIGEIVEIEMTTENSFRRIPTDKYLDEDDKRFKEAKINSSMSYNIYQNKLARKRVIKERNTIENMTIKELKEWVGKSYSRKSTVRSYLMSKF